MLLRKRYRQFRLNGYLKQSAHKVPSGLFINWSKLPDEELLDNELKDRIETAIRQMPIKYRMPLLLNNVEQFPEKESAKILGTKVNALKTRIHRARLMIKSEISDYFKDVQKKEGKQDRRCSIMTAFIYDYAKGNLDAKRQSGFKRHIKDCPSCNSFLDTYLKAIQITKAVECQDLSLELQAKIQTFLFKK
jgi:RNA polymerase sigma-70 factor (ECF subfamily)